MNPDFVAIPSVFGMICFVVWVTVTGWQRRQRLKLITEFNSRLLDRLGSVKDFSEFVQTEAGAKFMHSLSAAEPSSSVSPQHRIFSAVQLGTVLLSLGIGLLSLTKFTAIDAHGVLLVSGTIALSLGVGLLLSSGLSYRLASALGILKRAENG